MQTRNGMVQESNSQKELDLPPKNPRRKKLLIIFAGFFLFVGLCYLIYWLIIGRYYESTDDAYVSGNQVQVMPQISGIVTTILADETDFVKKGNPVVSLDQADAYIALKNAEAQLAITTRQVNQYYQNVAQIQANVEQKQANLEKAKEDYQRRQGLVVNQTISAEDLRHAKIAVDTAMDELTAAKHQLKSAITLAGTTDLYHHPTIQQASVNLRNAFLTWQRTTIYTPETGYVAKRSVEVGQHVDTNTILMIIIPLNQIWVDANFKESQLRNIRIGQPVKLFSDAYGKSIQYQGRVVGLSPGTGSAFDLLPPQNATGNWIKILQRVPVRIRIDSKPLQKYPLRIGFSMTVAVDTHNRKGDLLTQVSENKVIYQSKNYSADLEKANALIDKILRENAKNISLPITQQP